MKFSVYPMGVLIAVVGLNLSECNGGDLFDKFPKSWSCHTLSHSSMGVLHPNVRDAEALPLQPPFFPSTSPTSNTSDIYSECDGCGDEPSEMPSPSNPQTSNG